MRDYDSVENDSDYGSDRKQGLQDYACDDQMGGSADFGSYPQGMLPALPSTLGVTPQGLYGTPEGLYGEADHLGMGAMMDTLKKPIFAVAGISVTPLHLGLLAAVGGAYYYFKVYRKKR